MNKKACSRCKVEKPYGDFIKNKDTKIGLSSACLECIRSYEKSYRLKNHDMLKERHSLWYKNNKVRHAEIQKRWTKKSGYLTSGASRFRFIKFGAKKRGIKLSIGKEDFVKWFNETNKVCYYCSVSEEKAMKYTDHHLTVDRKNNSLGYSLQNIVFACLWCNTMKSHFMTEDEMKKIGKLIMRKKWSNLK